MSLIGQKTAVADLCYTIYHVYKLVQSHHRLAKNGSAAHKTSRSLAAMCILDGLDLVVGVLDAPIAY